MTNKTTAQGYRKDNYEEYFGKTAFGPVAGSNSLRTKSIEGHLNMAMNL